MDIGAEGDPAGRDARRLRETRGLARSALAECRRVSGGELDREQLAEAGTEIHSIIEQVNHFRCDALLSDVSQLGRQPIKPERCGADPSRTRIVVAILV